MDAIRKKFGEIEIPEFSVVPPENSEYGDYATNAAMVLAKILKKNPMEIASAVAEELRTKNLELRTEVAPPGFINFWLSREALNREFAEILKRGEKYGRGGIKKERISLDYLDANPTGPVHIGHARSGFLGDALANILEFSGHKVSREFYVNNAKSSAQIQSLGKTALGKGEEYKHDMMRRLLKSPRVMAFIKKSKDKKEVGFFIAQKIRKEIESFLKKTAGIKFDVWFEEQSAYDKKLTDKIVGKMREQGAIYEKDGALWFRASQFGDTEDRVIVRSTGEPTYVLPDIAYHFDRVITRKFDTAIDIFGADHHGYGPRLRGALQALGIDPKRIHIITMQTVRLIKGGEEFKMSKRKGVFVTLEDLIKEVGLDAARYFFLERSPDTHMDFDLGLAKERSVKNPVYYVQYAHARTSSIFQKVNLRKLDFLRKPDFLILNAPEELYLIKKLIQFPETVEDTANDYQVHRLTRYAHELAHTFHNFYEKQRVITKDQELTKARLALVKATQIVLKSVLGLLGISAPNKM